MKDLLLFFNQDLMHKFKIEKLEEFSFFAKDIIL